LSFRNHALSPQGHFLSHSFGQWRDITLLAFGAAQRFPFESGGSDQRLPSKLQ